jgi:hypothetical protein
MKRIPNVIELGRRPDVIRYVWILLDDKNNFHSGASWSSLHRIMKYHTGPHKMFLVVDTQRNKVFRLSPEKWLETWRPYYFDPNWEFSGEKSK